jgi:hypothetical protein
MRETAVDQMKKDAKGAYDPQVGEAAAANSALAERSVQFSEDYFNKYIAPAIEQMTAASADTQRNQNELYADNKADMQTQRDRYKKFGIPAEDAYYKAVQDYNEPEKAEQMARAAGGDQAAAQANQKQQVARQMAGLGIDPSSPAAISAMGDMAIMGAAASAGAVTRAREAAKMIGMQLKSDAANFGRGGQSAVLGYGGVGLQQGGLAGANSGAAVNQAGYGLGLKGYGANLDAYTSLNKASMEASAQSQAGLGNFLGTIGAAAMPAGGLFGSDRRLKTDIVQVGTLGEFDLPIYNFRYIWQKPGTLQQGVMAQDVLKHIPEAVVIDAAGFYAVDYGMLR